MDQNLYHTNLFSVTGATDSPLTGAHDQRQQDHERVHGVHKPKAVCCTQSWAVGEGGFGNHMNSKKSTTLSCLILVLPKQ